MIGLLITYIIIDYKILKALDGDYIACVLLQHILEQEQLEKEEWIALKYKEISSKLLINDYQIRKAKSKLEKIGFIQTKLKKVDGVPILHFKVNKSTLYNTILEKLLEHEYKNQQYGNFKAWGE